MATGILGVGGKSEAATSLNGAQPPVLGLSQDQVNEISSLLGLNIVNPDQLIQRVRAMRQITVEGVDITLDPGLVNRLRSRCVKKDGFADYLTAEIKRLLHGAVGY